MKFLVQTNELGQLNLDFCWHIERAVEYLKSFRNQNHEIKYTHKELFPNYIPIGSIEFVLEYIKTYYGGTILPKNVPECLMRHEFTKRHIFNGTEKDIKGLKFIKSNDVFKGITVITTKAEKGNYQISDVIDIHSEYRVFVFNGNIESIKHYSGYLNYLYNYDTIKKMVDVYEENNAPVAYTLDVGVTSRDETVIIEVHDFFSVGLYGWDDYNKIPFMFSQWWHQFTNNGCGVQI